MAIHSFKLSEDLDLNAAIGQLAVGTGQLHCTLPDADTLQLPDMAGMYLKRIRVVDETAGGLDGYLHFPGKGSERKFRFGKLVELGDKLITDIEFGDGDFPLDPGQKIKAFGNISGSGAEQHVIVLDIELPSIPEPAIHSGPVKHLHMLGVKTGTLVDSVLGGLNSILGDETALEDSEIQFAEHKNYVLKGFWATPGLAGTGILGVRHPSGLIDRLSPATFTQLNVPPFIALDWAFKGTAPPRALGCGKVVTSTELTYLLGELDN